MALSQRRLLLAAKVFAVCAGLAIIVSLVASSILYNGARRALRESVREELMALASTAAIQIDPGLHEQIKTHRDESSRPYKEIRAKLRAIQRANPNIYCLYTMRKSNKAGTFEFIVDGDDEPCHVGYEYDATRFPEMLSSFDRPAADYEIAQDEWGTWLSGYAPIKDASGKAVAIIGLDMSVDQLQKKEHDLSRAIKMNIAAAIILGVLLSLLVVKALLHPIRILSQAAHRVRNGDLDFQLPALGRDEMWEVRDAFNQMITVLKESRERLMEQATHDILTGLFNHMYFQERLVTEIDRAASFGRSLSLLVVDLDHFKSINDGHGHGVGDSILRQLALVLRDSIRSIDVPARYAGDEFAIILPETDLESAKEAAAKIRAAVEGHAFQPVPISEMIMDGHTPARGKTIKTTVTVGISSYPQHHSSRDGLVMAADIALCRAKQTSRNSICTYDEAVGGAEHLDPSDIYQALHNPDVAAIRSLAAAVDAKDRYTCGHSERVAEYALKIGEALGLDQAVLDSIHVAGLLHDLGKIGVPDSILNKPGNLTDDEFEVIQRHPSVGADILRRAPQLDIIIPAVLYHHERWDGAGYPNGIARESIPLIARILAVADTFDAMTSDRPYRQAMPMDIAMAKMRACSGMQFDPVVMEAFVAGMRSQGQNMAA